MPDDLNLADLALPFLDVAMTNRNYGKGKGEGWYRVHRGGYVERWTSNQHGRWYRRHMEPDGRYAEKARRLAELKGYQLRVAA